MLAGVKQREVRRGLDPLSHPASTQHAACSREHSLRLGYSRERLGMAAPLCDGHSSLCRTGDPRQQSSKGREGLQLRVEAVFNTGEVPVERPKPKLETRKNSPYTN